MSEKRKPEYVLFAKKPGNKKIKLELFKATLWPKWYWVEKKFRLRINGKWFKLQPSDLPRRKDAELFTLSHVMNELRKWVNRRRRHVHEPV